MRNRALWCFNIARAPVRRSAPSIRFRRACWPHISVWQYRWSGKRRNADQILLWEQRAFSALRAPFWTSRYIFNAYSSRAIDSALFYNDMVEYWPPKVIESNVVIIYVVQNQALCDTKSAERQESFFSQLSTVDRFLCHKVIDSVRYKSLRS